MLLLLLHSLLLHLHHPPGGLLSGALFQYPGAFIMTAVGVFAADQLTSSRGVLGGVASGVLAW